MAFWCSTTWGGCALPGVRGNAGGADALDPAHYPQGAPPLTRAGLVTAKRAHGGYALARPAERITLAEAIAALQGPLALTDCCTRRAPRDSGPL